MIVFNPEEREAPPISVGLAFSMLFERGVQLPINAAYEDPRVEHIAQRLAQAQDEAKAAQSEVFAARKAIGEAMVEIKAATADLIKLYNLSTEVERVVELNKRADAPVIAKIMGVVKCGACGNPLIARGQDGMFCPCWPSKQRQEPPKPVIVDDGWIPGPMEICGRAACDDIHVDQCCLCGKPLCSRHMADGCCGHTPAISDRQITEEFQLEARYEDDEHAPDAECALSEAL